MSSQLRKRKPKPNKKQIAEAREVFEGTPYPIKLDLLTPNDLTKKMKPFRQQVDLKSYGTGILLNYDPPENTYLLVNDPCRPRTVWPKLGKHTCKTLICQQQ